MRILFLDIDGVLINRSDYASRRPGAERVALLNRLLAVTGARIVISSSHRIGKNRIQMCDIFNDWGVTPGLILDLTPVINSSDSHAVEIAAWLKHREERCNDVENFVVIDDDLSDMHDFLPQLIQTTKADGLTSELVDKAVGMLVSKTAVD